MYSYNCWEIFKMADSLSLKLQRTRGGIFFRFAQEPSFAYAHSGNEPTDRVFSSLKINVNTVYV